MKFYSATAQIWTNQNSVTMKCAVLVMTRVRNSFRLVLWSDTKSFPSLEFHHIIWKKNSFAWKTRIRKACPYNRKIRITEVWIIEVKLYMNHLHGLRVISLLVNMNMKFMKLLIAFVISAAEENQVMFVVIASICFGLLSGVASSPPGEL